MRHLQQRIPTTVAWAALCFATACSRDADTPIDATRAHAVAWRTSGAAAGANVLLISVDTLRADRLGFEGHAGADTPNLDRLAAEGVRYTQAVSPTPVTLPAHASLLTGARPTTHGVRHNGTFVLDDAAETLAERLSAADYRTAAFTAAFVLDRRYGLAQGFDLYDDAVNPTAAIAVDARFNERPADRVVDAALAWLAQDVDDAPFFAFVHLFDPHAPYAPPPPFDRGDRYDGELAFVDRQIGRLLDALRKDGTLDRTIVVFTSDHGESLGDHGEPTHGVFLYDVTVRVPLVFGPPCLDLAEARSEGTRCERGPTGIAIDDRPAGLVDVAPTLLDWLGLPPLERADGIPLDGRESTERGLFLESLVPLLDFGWAPLRGWRTIDRKFVSAPREEWYRLDEDPDERRNRLPELESEATPSREALGAALEGTPDPLAVADRERGLDAETKARLASLGYVRGAGRTPVRGVHDPKDRIEVWTRTARAGAYAAEGRLDEAMDDIRFALAEDPDDAKVWYTAARVFEARKQPVESERCLRQAAALDPRAETFAQLAIFALRRGDRETYTADLAAAEALDPRDGGVWLARGVLAASERRYDEALAHFEKAVEFDPWRAGPKAAPHIERLKEILAGGP
ncbi:MAG: sulfatase-like hydrolase/transferase [Planctomycetota bacterium]|nr:sulfatase-like hydrolase/transferase [Planctomycetota bacterium]